MVSQADALSYSLGYLTCTPHVHSHSHPTAVVIQATLPRVGCAGTPEKCCWHSAWAARSYSMSISQPQGNFCEDASKICGEIPHVPCGNWAPDTGKAVLHNLSPNIGLLGSSPECLAKPFITRIPRHTTLSEERRRQSYQLRLQSHCQHLP